MLKKRLLVATFSFLALLVFLFDANHAHASTLTSYEGANVNSYCQFNQSSSAPIAVNSQTQSNRQLGIVKIFYSSRCNTTWWAFQNTSGVTITNLYLSSQGQAGLSHTFYQGSVGNSGWVSSKMVDGNWTYVVLTLDDIGGASKTWYL